MTKKTVSQVNFTSGIVSPRLYGHVDLNKYKNGVKDAVNVNVLPHGPLARRAGSVFIHEVKNSAKETILYKFQFNEIFAYILEFGDLYVRFYKDGALVLSGGLPYELVTTYAEDEIADLSIVQFGNTLYIAHPDHPIATLTWHDDADWELEDVFFYPPPTDEDGDTFATTLTPAAVSGNGVNFTAGSAVFLAGDVGREISNQGGDGRASIVSVTSTTVVVADIIEAFPSTSAITSGNWKLAGTPIAKLTMDGTSIGATTTIKSYYTDSALGVARAITGISKANPGVVTSNGHGFVDGDKVLITNAAGMTQVNTRAWTVKGATANTFNLANDDNADFDTTNYTAYNGSGIARRKLIDIPLNVFRATDVGKFIKINNGVAKITAYTDAQTITVQIQKSLNSASGSAIWSKESLSWTSTKGYPRSLALHQGRLWAASTADAIQTVWASEPGIFDSIGIGSGDGDGLQFDVATREVNQINWMVGIRDSLILGTSSAELSIDSTTGDGGITPSAKEKPRGYAGSNPQIPQTINNEILFIQKGGTKLNSFYYDFSIDNYKPDNLLFLAEHLAKDGGGINHIAYADTPDSQIFAVLQDGTMLVASYVRDQEVIGWTRYATDGEYKSVQVLATEDGDEVWVIVAREIGSNDVQYVERFDFSDVDSHISVFSDCSLTYSQPKVLSSVTLANPGVFTVTAHGYNNGDLVKFFDMEGAGNTDVLFSSIEGKTYIVANKTTDTFTLTTQAGVALDTSLFETFLAGIAHKQVLTISGLSHLEGETVQVKADGATHPDRVVTSGAITLQFRASEVTVGKEYASSITLLPLEYSLDGGSQQGQAVRWVRPVIRLYKSALPLLNNEFLPARYPGDLMDAAVPLFSGDAIYGPLTWNAGSGVTISASYPLPLLVSGIFGTIDGGLQ